MFNIFRDKFALAVIYISCYGLLGVMYSKYVPIFFGYEGYFFEFNSIKAAMSVLALLLSAFLIDATKPVSSVILYFCLFLIIIPTLVLFSCGGGGWELFFLSVLAFFVIGIIPRNNFHYNVYFGLDSVTQYMRVLLGFASFVVIAAAAYSGFGNFNLNFSEVYSYRQISADSLPSVFGYLFPVVSKIIVPFGFAVALFERRRFESVAFIAVAVLTFGFTSHKAVIFYPIFTLIAFWLLGTQKYSLKLAIALFSFLSLMFVFFVFAMQYSEAMLYAVSLFVRRGLLTPAYLNSFYVDFFSVNPFLWWSESRFSFGLSDRLYNLRSVNLIGYEYFGKSDLAANAGWIGSGYANAGLWGVLFYSLLIGLILTFFDKQANIKQPQIILSSTVPIMVTIFSSTDFSTAIFTHGLFFCVIFVLMLPQHLSFQNAENAV